MSTPDSKLQTPNLRIIFMGTPDFAVASLDALVKAGCHIVGVITAPDKLKNPQFIEALRALQADLQIVVAFRMLPEIVWDMPPLGTVNLHGSLLPQYRGAAPIHWAVINGEKETGVTTFKLKHEIDTGDILLQKSFPIGDDETTGEVHDRMEKIDQSSVVCRLSSVVLKHAPKIFTETCQIDWNMGVNSIHNLIRGLSPFPGALTVLDGKILKVYRSKKETTAQNDSPGKVVSDGKTFLKFACTNGYIHILDMQLEGKKRMLVEDFLRGYRLTSV
jgi:methionyl-tRNA formyltransferase